MPSRDYKIELPLSRLQFYEDCVARADEVAKIGLAEFVKGTESLLWLRHGSRCAATRFFDKYSQVLKAVLLCRRVIGKRHSKRCEHRSESHSLDTPGDAKRRKDLLKQQSVRGYCAASLRAVHESGTRKCGKFDERFHVSDVD